MSSYKDRASEKGDFKEKSLISHKFIKAVEHLIQKKEVSSKKEISERYGYSKSLITLISTSLSIFLSFHVISCLKLFPRLMLEILLLMEKGGLFFKRLYL